MRLIAIAFLTAGLAFPVVVEKPAKAPKQETTQQETAKKKKERPVKRALKKTGNGLLSAILFVAEPER